MMRWVLLCALLCTGCSLRLRQSLTDVSSKTQDALNRGDADQALALARRGALEAATLKSPEWQWKFRCLQAESLNQRGRAAAAYSLLAGPLPDELAAGAIAVRVQLDRAVSLMSLGQPDNAEAALDFAERLSERPENAPWLAQLNLRRGVLERVRKNLERAQFFLLKAIELGRRYRQDNIVCTAMTNLGKVLIDRGDYSGAMTFVPLAIDLARKIGNRIQVENNLTNWGLCSYNLGDFDVALERLREADRIAAQIDRPLDREAAINLIGLVYSARGDFGQAGTYYLQGLHFARQANNAEGIGECLHNLAKNGVDLEDLEAASRYSREEIQVKGNAEDPYARYIEGLIAEKRKNFALAENAFQQVIGRTKKNLPLRWQAQFRLATTHAASNRLDLAQRDFDEVLKTLEQARRQLGSREFKITFRSGLNPYYNSYIRFFMNRQRYVDALNVAEFSRALVLSEHLAIQENARLDEDTLRQTARSLHATILSYWLTPVQSYLWIVTAEKVTAVALPAGTEIADLAAAHRSAVASSGKPVSTRLYETLVAPAQPYIPHGGRVIVIPDGSLHMVNFETLLVPGEPAPHYWIEDAIVSTATSLALMQPSPHPVPSGKILLIGNPTSPDPRFPALPNAGVELHSIAAKFPAGRSELHDLDAARPSIYKTSHPSEFAWIHFAAHGVASKDSPLDSAIVLSNEGDSYKLYAKDIANTPLTADLVTISACYGSGATTYAGEGIVGLAWAFLYAGAHNVIAALWEVSDVYTAQLMDDLYERLKSGDDAAMALRAAKLALVHSAYPGRHPRYWGAFQLYSGY